MMRNTSVLKTIPVAAVLCALLCLSCEKPLEDTVVEVSVKTSQVGSSAGEMFVSVKCSGSWTLSLFDDSAAGDLDWAVLSDSSGQGDKNNVRLKYQANNDTESRRLRIVLDNGKKWSQCTVEQAGVASRPDDGSDDGSDDGTGSGSGSSKGNLKAGTGWMELPAMDDNALGYYTHSFKQGGKSYRNYSFGWSQKDRVALWVAYPHCKFYLNGSAGRTDEWALDPLLGEDSAAPFGGYAGSYARGHQIPSADRQCCYEANAQTFYGTNMTPQLNAHNEGIWSELEGMVRGYASSSDTTYVVTGVTVSDSSKKEEDSYGNSVTIPDAYFKAVLKYSKSSTLGAWNAAAFYLEHRNYSESLGKKHSMSIDELEELTGIDFFVNLPAKVGEDQAAKIEAADPASSSVWW